MSDESEGSVHLVGTAHVSQDSVETVEREIEERDPDVVAVELDEGRYRQLKGEAPDDIDPKDLLRGSLAFQFLAYWLLSYVQQRLGEKFDVSPGADMLAAVETAQAHEIDVALVDRNIQVTIQRFWTRMGTVEKLKMVAGLAFGIADPWLLGLSVGFVAGGFGGFLVELFAGPFVLPGGGLLGIAAILAESVAIGAAASVVLGAVLALLFARTDPDEEYDELTMEDLTDGDVVSAMMEEFRRFSPAGAEALIDERDAYLAHNLVRLRESGRSVVAVIGAGHEAGVQAYLDDPSTLPPMESLTGRAEKRFSLAKAFGFLLTVGFLVFFLLLLMSGIENRDLLRVFLAWVMFNGVFSAGLALVGGARIRSAAVGGAVAWLTSLNPLLAPGWFAGYVELRYTPVSISDISTLNEIMSDEESPVRDLLARMRQVPLFKLIAVVALTNVGSFVASVLFPFVVLPYLGGPFDSVGELTAAMKDGIANSIDLVTHLL